MVRYLLLFGRKAPIPPLTASPSLCRSFACFLRALRETSATSALSLSYFEARSLLVVELDAAELGAGGGVEDQQHLGAVLEIESEQDAVA